MILMFKFAEIIQDEGFGAIGQNIYVNYVPFDTTEAIMVRPPISGVPISSELPNYYKGVFSLVLRSAGDLGALEQKTLEISNVLTIYDRQVSNELLVNYMRPLQLPHGYPITKGELVEVKVDFAYSVVFKP